MRNKINLTFMCVLIIAVFMLFVPAVALAEEEGPNILFILDSSGSMMNPIGNVEPKMEAAKRVLSDLVASLPAETNVGLEAYGHREKTGCDDIEIVVPVGKLDVDVIKQKINSLEALGNTPIASALERGADEIHGLKGKRTIVLISDGEETCKGDPISAAEQIRKRLGIDVIIQVIGLAVDDKAKQQLAGIARAGGGNYYSADNAEQLKQSLTEIKKEVVKKEPPKDIFVEEFDKTFLSEDWEIVNDNSDSRVLEDGIFYIISAPGSFSKESVQNMLLYNKPIEKKNYGVVTRFNVPLTNYGNSADGQQWNGLIFYANKDNMIGLVVHGFYGYFTGGSGNARLAQFFKIQGGKWATSFNTPVYRGKNTDPQPYYLKIEKKKFKYTAYYSTDGQKWNKIGTIAMLGKKLKPGIFAVHGNNAQEVVVEFDSFRIKELE